jgi:hypothetical protein
MKRRYFFGLLTALTLVGAAHSSALITNSTISYDGTPIAQKVRLQGVMPVIRLIYVDPQGHITRVIGNTDQNIEPIVVLDGTPRHLVLTPYINEQYQLILASQNGRLAASTTYYPVKPSYVAAVINKTSLDL